METMRTDTNAADMELRDRFRSALEARGWSVETSLGARELFALADEVGIRYKEARELGEALWEERRAAAESTNGTHAPEPETASLGERVKAWLAAEGLDWHEKLPEGSIGRCARALGVKGNQVAGTVNCFRLAEKRAAARASGTAASAWVDSEQNAVRVTLGPKLSAPVSGLALQAGTACIQLADALLEHGMAGVPEGLRAPLRAVLRWRLTEEE